MSEPAVLTINTDGAARGNPGPAAYAYVITRDGAPPIEEAGCLGRMTSNKAEYTALVRALEHAARLGTRHRLVILSDSELLVKQMNGEYRVKDPDLRSLYEEAQQLCNQFDKVTIRHVRRAQNGRADELCNEALDGKRGPTRSPQPPAWRDEAVAYLREAAQAWARSDASEPAPEAVVEQLWALLKKRGAVR
jgi:ribonuclease HI